ncbi:MAG: carboxypeptidase-like regulatory domain-containing protein [Candidatus Eisenbacteria bacterium]
MNTHRLRTSRRNPHRLSFLALGLVTMLLLGAPACSPDYHETVGPTVPVPNLFGRVTREGAAAPDLKLAIEDSAEVELSAARTNSGGWFEFEEVPAGAWTVRIDSQEPTDFARLTYEFTFLDPEAGLTLPDLEIGLGEFDVKKPNEGAQEPVPGFFSPLEFRWSGLGGEKQIRFYRDSDGAPVWFSAKTTADIVRWNGIGNQGEFQNVSVPPGDYRWRIRVDGAGTVRYYTAYRALTLEE